MPGKSPRLKPLRDHVHRKTKWVWITDGGRQVQIQRLETKDEAVRRVLREREKRGEKMRELLRRQEERVQRTRNSARQPVEVHFEHESADPDFNDVQMLYTREHPLVQGQNNRRLFAEGGVIHATGGNAVDQIIEPEDLLDRIRHCEELVADSNLSFHSDVLLQPHIPALMQLYAQAMEQGLSHRQDNYTPFRNRATHYNTRRIDDTDFSVFVNTQDVDNALESVDELTDTIVEHGWSLTAGGKKFFEDVFVNSMSISQTIYESQRVTGKQMRAIANWTRGVGNWVH